MQRYAVHDLDEFMRDSSFEVFLQSACVHDHCIAISGKLPKNVEPYEARAVGLKRLFSARPFEVREALRGYFVDGRIIVGPVAEGHYVAEGRFLPLVGVVDRALDLAPSRGATVLVVLR